MARKKTPIKAAKPRKATTECTIPPKLPYEALRLFMLRHNDEEAQEVCEYVEARLAEAVSHALSTGVN